MDHSQALGLRHCLLQLVDFLEGGIEAAIAFDCFPVGAGDSPPESEKLSAGLSQVPAYAAAAARDPHAAGLTPGDTCSRGVAALPMTTTLPKENPGRQPREFQ